MQLSSYIPSVRGIAKFSACLSIVGLTAVAVGLYFGQTYLIYPAYLPPRSREEVSTPADYEIPYDDLELESADGTRVKAYLIKQRKVFVGHNAAFVPQDLGAVDSKLTDDEYASTRPTIIFFHANAGNLGHRLPLARVFYARMRCNVLMLSYRGYGRSEGYPTEQGIRLDAQATLDYLRTHPLLHSTQVILYGQSLGGAVCIDLASRNPEEIHAIILENTFQSVSHVARKVMPWVTPFLFLCTEKWRSEESLKKIPAIIHMLFMSGLKDELVPPEQMKALWEIARRDVKGLSKRQWEEFPGGTHNDTYVQPEYWSKVKEFIESVTSEQVPEKSS
ncbi:alpha/beta-hydrolase [Cantharellus anzutake]|uniref:alpha/beta-hydrolase n=1 Tax=Cantharellus anzutake TaxID=1750568 RepID=UPI0019041157|nr:alpha/beta-hydrolase [Cantharellus anzutake]KAF8328136.1 alpha/beta-hydrolase [Cantharellus anzutake]